MLWSEEIDLAEAVITNSTGEVTTDTADSAHQATGELTVKEIKPTSIKIKCIKENPQLSQEAHGL